MRWIDGVLYWAQITLIQRYGRNLEISYLVKSVSSSFMLIVRMIVTFSSAIIMLRIVEDMLV